MPVLRIAVAGDLVLDVLVRPGDALAPDSDVRGTVELLPGGSAANVAVWAARLGAAVSFLGAVGGDFIGDHLRADLEAEGVDAAGVVRLRGRSPAVFALVGPDGGRTMVTDRSATLRFAPEHVAAEAFDGARHLHLTAYSYFDPGPAAAAKECARLARVRGATVSLDLSSSALLLRHGAERTRAEIRALRPDVLFGNEQECAALAGEPSLDDALASLRGLAPVLVAKLGPRGCMLSTAEGPARIPTTPVQPLDTTGAGDAFDAAWLCAHLSGATHEDACREANALARRVVRVPGARPALLDP